MEIVVFIALACGVLFIAKRIKDAHDKNKYDGRVEPRRPPSDPK